ncbi:MAG: ABC transporter substrate-binding protein [Ruminococcus sp.]|nr:ABC transporter substrate-binding protein [Ruminococcus sp.]
MKKFVALLLVLFVCLPVVAACSTLQGDNDKGATISMYLTDFPQTLDPAAVQLQADTAMIFSLIYQPLTTIGEKGKVKPGLAYEWYSYYDNRDEEYKMYFKLNETMWSDGIAVSADDVVYAWKRILSPDSESPYASLLFPIKNARQVKSGIMTSDDLGLVAEDDKLLSITFEEDYDTELFAEAVSCIALSPLREDIITRAIKNNTDNSREQDWDKNAAIMVCNGPFRVQGLEEGVKLSLERNQYYYRDDEEDKLDESVIPFRLVCYYENEKIDKKDTAEATEQQFQADKFDAGKSFYLGNFDKTTFAKYASSITTNKLLSTYTYYFNTKNDILKDAKVRQALSAALDRQAIVNAIGKNYIASTGFVPSGVFDTASGTDFRKAGGDIYSTTADTAKATSFLNEAGVKGGTLRLAYLVPVTKNVANGLTDKFGKISYELASQIAAESAKASWEALGFTIELVPVYAEEFQSTLSSGNFDIIGVDYAVNSTDAIAYLAPFATKYSGNKVSISLDAETYNPHYTGLSDEEYDTLLDEVIYLKDRTERATKLHAIETKLAELCPATAVFQYTTSYTYNEKILKNISSSYYGYNDFSDIRMSNYIETNSRENEESLNEAKTRSTGDESEG